MHAIEQQLTVICNTAQCSDIPYSMLYSNLILIRLRSIEFNA